MLRSQELQTDGGFVISSHVVSYIKSLDVWYKISRRGGLTSFKSQAKQPFIRSSSLGDISPTHR